MTHLRGVHDHVTSRLDDAELAELARLLTKLTPPAPHRPALPGDHDAGTRNRRTPPRGDGGPRDRRGPRDPQADHRAGHGRVGDVRLEGVCTVRVLLTIAGCPLRDKITRDVTAAVGAVDGVTGVRVDLGVMSDDQRKGLSTPLRGGAADKEVPFAQPGSLTRVYAVASGKGGVGKSSVTVNLAVAMAASGLKVGVVDADIYGHSIPRMLGTTGKPTPVEQMIMPPSAHGVKVISIGMFTAGNSPVVWRGPMLHRALQQFLADVFWGDLDVLLLDLPPGTGDIAISVAQLIPNAELIVVTTPQLAAREVAERAGSIAVQTRQTIAGVVENMAGLPCPHCGEMVEVFGSGGGQAVAEGAVALDRHQRPAAGLGARSTCGCARAATAAARSCSMPPTHLPPRSCGRSPRRCPRGPAGWSAVRWASPPRTELRAVAARYGAGSP